MDNVYEPMWYLLCHYRLFIVFFFLCISNPPGYKNSRVFKWILSGPARPHSIYLCMEVLGFNGKIQSAKFSDDPQRRVGNDFGSFLGGPWKKSHMIGLSGLSGSFLPVFTQFVRPFTWMSVDCFTFFCVRMWVFPKGKGQLQWIIFGGWWFIDKNAHLHAIGAVAHGLPLAWCTTGIETLSLKLRTLNLLQQTPPLPCHDGTLGCTPHNGIVNFHQNLSESYQRAECRKSQVYQTSTTYFPQTKAFNLSEPLAKELIKAAPSRDVHGARRPG